MSRTILCLMTAILSVHAIPQVTIRSNDIPFVIGTYARYEQNSNSFEWLPFDSLRTWWDLTAYPAGSYARVRLLQPSQGDPPAPDTFSTAEIAELDTMGIGTEVWTYLSFTEYYLYGQGIDYWSGGFRFLGNYQPDYRIYALPIYDGAGWNTAWTWTYEIEPYLPYTANEQHMKTIVAAGKVRVPMSGIHYWPCLVVRDHMSYSDNFGTVDTRWIYEWLVPGRFGGGNGVAAALSTNGASYDFMIVESFLKMETLSVPGWDVHGPEFAGTTVWPDTAFLGPYVVSTVITDSTGIGADSLFYNVDGSAFNGVTHDSVHGDTFYFTIPPVMDSCTIGYFLWAEDSFSVADSVDLWHTDPICAPESTYYTFQAATGIAAHGGQGYVAHLTCAPNPFRDHLDIGFTQLPGSTCHLKILDCSGRVIQERAFAPVGAVSPSSYRWNGKDIQGRTAASGVYFVELVSGNRKDRATIVHLK